MCFIAHGARWTLVVGDIEAVSQLADKTMEKMIIFTQGSRDQFKILEDEFNAWMQKHPNVQIVSRLATSTYGINELEGRYVNVTVIVFYKEGK